MTANPDLVTDALLAMSREDTVSSTSGDLWDLVYPQLHVIAARMMRGEVREHTLQPTALIHEAYIRLVDQSRVQWRERAQFFAIAARIMRRILIDHARQKGARKRGGEWQRVTLVTCSPEDSSLDRLEVVALETALNKLEREDDRVARVVEFRVFAGMTMEEIADVLGVSARTVHSDWAFALRWLAATLEQDSGFA